MQDSGIPAKYQKVWGADAGASFIRTPPVASQIGIQNGAASFTDGFPPNCFSPVAAGGAPPFGQDFNGILNLITAWQQWQQAGGPIAYDATFQTEIGGYPSGAIVQSAVTPGKFWMSLADNNTTNPDSGGAGWISALGGRLLNTQVFNASGTYTPTPGATKALVLVLGAGGAGGGAAATSSAQISLGAGGNAGALALALISNLSEQTVTIGLGGVGASAAAGTAGGTTSFGSLVTASGGAGGLRSGPTAPPLTAGNGFTGALSSGGNIISGVGAVSPIGFVASLGVGFSGAGANTLFGCGGGANNNSSSGTSAFGPGAGGAGALALLSSPAASGGDGANGLCVVWECS
jgi:hypothetical protein